MQFQGYTVYSTKLLAAQAAETSTITDLMISWNRPLVISPWANMSSNFWRHTCHSCINSCTSRICSDSFEINGIPMYLIELQSPDCRQSSFNSPFNLKKHTQKPPMQWWIHAIRGGQCDTGWWLTYPSEKYEFVSWDDYSQYMEK